MLQTPFQTYSFLTRETSYQCLYLTGPKLSDLVSESEVPPTQAIGPSVWGGGDSNDFMLNLKLTT